MNLKPSEIKKFQKIIWDYYITSGRKNLPWRKSINPYKIWVSEVMLQQTQVDRVVPFFIAWMKQFPTIQKLASASQVDLLRLWKGLGYNSRALRMKQTAQIIVKNYKGKFPKTVESLQKLPGIGPYTAGAISAFAFNQSMVIIETNIRRVFIHHFFTDRSDVHDDEILLLVEQTLDIKKPREWYWALMDYGAFLGRTLHIKGKKYNPNIQSKHYTKQSKFIGSDREIRGDILSILLQEKNTTTFNKLVISLKKYSENISRINKILNQLENEGFIVFNNTKIVLKK
jgi:A/G-specific adenine glycosylase